MLQFILLVLLGLLAGSASGLIGIGGGIVIIPALVFLFGFTQHQAQGTTLALMLPPITLFAVWNYYKGGHIDIRASLLVCAGFLLGSWIGSKAAVSLSGPVLQKIFGGTMTAFGLYMLLKK